jgi:hypothetical protein
MRVIEPQLISTLVAEHLRMPKNFAETLEGRAEFARQVSSFECPCSERHLVQSLALHLTIHADSQSPSNSGPTSPDLAEALITGLFEHGDLIEIEESETGSSQVALRAPAACSLSDSKIVLLGIVPFAAKSFPDAFRSKLEFKGYGRFLTFDDSTSALNELRSFGYVVISETEWAQLPKLQNARLHVASYTSRFRTDIETGHIEGLRLLDSARPATHYKSRWTDKATRDGDFVARRQRRYGSDAWSFLRIRELQPASLLDLPTKSFPFRACDEAWHLQQAIDLESGHPQRYRIEHETSGRITLQFFSPIPQWAHRRLTLLGEQVDSQNCLLAYRFASADIADAEVNFVETRMWLAKL